MKGIVGMGIFSGKDHPFNSKWITAEISDSSGRLHFIPIKFVIGDYFVCDILKQTYAFKMVGQRIKRWPRTVARSCFVLHYDTSHYLPLSDKNAKEIQDVLEKNHLPKIDGALFRVLKIVGNKESKNFKAKKLKELFKVIGDDKKSEYGKEKMILKDYLDRLSVDQIVTPVRPIVEFIEGEIRATDPAFLGSIVNAVEQVDHEHKKISNVPEGPKKPIMKIALLAIMGIILILGIWYLHSSGILEGGIPGFKLDQFSPGGGQTSDAALMQQYPTPEAAKAAIDRGELDYNSLSPTMKKFVDSYKPPTVTP